MQKKSSLLFLIFLFSCLLPLSARAAVPIPRQQLELGFDIEAGRLHGKSVLTLPRDTPLHLVFTNLERVRISMGENGNQTTLVPDKTRKTLDLEPAAQERVLHLSWQVDTAGRSHAGNLISPRGITLTGFWHPVADQDMLYSLKAVLPRSFSGITEADKLQNLRKNNKTLVTAEYPHPLRAVNFAAGPYRISSRKVGGTTVSTWFFREDQHLSAGYLDRAESYIKRYEKLLGPFPFPRYAIVENRLPTGYGMPTFTLLGQAVVRLPFIKDTSLGHEILHSWFGNALQLDKSGNWCEGLTTYLADQSFAADKGQDSEYRKNQLLRYQAYVHPDNITALIDFRNAGDNQPLAKKMRAIGYDKGSMVFHMLHRELGDELFFKALRQLYGEKKFRRIGWTDIEQQFSRTAGRDLSAFFGQWLLRRDVPKLGVEDLSVEQLDGKSRLVFTLVQQNEAPYLLQVPLGLSTLTGDEVKKSVAVSSLRQEITVVLDSLPVELRIDPEYDLMRELLPDEAHPAWMQFLGAEQKTVVLPDKKKLELYMPLVAELERNGCELVTAAELKNSALAKGSFVFLGPSSHTLGLFGRVDRPAKGFTLDVRKNPLNPGQVMVLVTTSSTRQTAKVIRKLSHYGKYSYLHFKDGRIREKRIAPAQEGITFPLLTPPSGVPVREMKNFSAIMDDLGKSRVIYVGEMHTDYSSHMLQLQIIQALYQKNPNLMIGMEMFPRSSQAVLDDYISGKIKDEREFIKQSRYYDVWGYDYRMYRDIIGFAGAHGIPLIGLNLDKKIVSTVFKTGSTDELDREQLAQVAAERDLDLPGYRKRLQAVHSMHGQGQDKADNGFGGFLQAQSMWDETMAESIVMALRDHPDRKMVVLAGTGHVFKDSAVPPRVARRMVIRQSVVAGDNGRDRGLREGAALDYLMFPTPLDLAPAGKIGVVLHESKADDDKPGQVEIIRISPHGKAGQAGLQEKDIILAVDDFPVSTVGELKAGLMDKAPGDRVTIKIRRDRESRDIEVELSNMDQAAMMLPPGHPKK